MWYCICLALGVVLGSLATFWVKEAKCRECEVERIEYP